MTSFRFPLQKVLDWRKTQLELEEARFQQQMAALAAIDCAYAEMEASGIRAEVEVRRWDPLAGRDLAALGHFRLRVQSREKQIALQRTECQRELAVRKSAMLEARRRCRLLERLKERRLAEWTSARDRELEEVASESFLARWARRRA
jgi:flagellar export protein FliJ